MPHEQTPSTLAERFNSLADENAAKQAALEQKGAIELERQKRHYLRKAKVGKLVRGVIDFPGTARAQMKHQKEQQAAAEQEVLAAWRAVMETKLAQDPRVVEANAKLEDALSSEVERTSLSPEVINKLVQTTAWETTRDPASPYDRVPLHAKGVSFQFTDGSEFTTAWTNALPYDYNDTNSAYLTFPEKGSLNLTPQMCEDLSIPKKVTAPGWMTSPRKGAAASTELSDDMVSSYIDNIDKAGVHIHEAYAFWGNMTEESKQAAIDYVPNHHYKAA